MTSTWVLTIELTLIQTFLLYTTSTVKADRSDQDPAKPIFNVRTFDKWCLHAISFHTSKKKSLHHQEKHTQPLLKPAITKCQIRQQTANSFLSHGVNRYRPSPFSTVVQNPSRNVPYSLNSGGNLRIAFLAHDTIAVLLAGNLDVSVLGTQNGPIR